MKKTMNKNYSNIRQVSLVSLLLCFLSVFSGTGLASSHAQFKKVQELIDNNCIDCHDSDIMKGNVNMEPLFDAEKFDREKMQKLFVKIDRAISSGDMPPKGEDPLTDVQKKSMEKWFFQSFALRDGKEYIGTNTLRRLTRYEIENTLEDLLHIKLKYPYAHSYNFPSMEKSYIEEQVPEDLQGESGFRNDSSQLQEATIPFVKLINYMDYVLRLFENNPEAQKKFFGQELKKRKYSSAEVKKLLSIFMRKAFRGYNNSSLRSQVLKAYVKHSKSNRSYHSLYHAFKVALLSPGFLYHMESSKRSNKAYKITDRDLANRLSYFLWSSMPDDELMKLVQEKKLSEKSVLQAQIKRMLNSPKRVSLSENFAGQWLGFEALRTDKRFFNGKAWTRAIYDELLFFFDELIKSDRSVLDIVNSNWTYKSRYTKMTIAEGEKPSKEPLYANIFAERYKQPGRLENFYHPPKFVSITDGKLGGMITTNGIMRLTSAPDRTSPIRRGVWLTEVIIGRHMEAPENVPPLSESEKAGGKKLTRLVDILHAHTNKKACISCHKHIDPLGMGLENFSPFGEFRTKYKDNQNIISNGKLPNGQSFDNPQKLKGLLVDYYKDDIVKNIIKRMMSYAYGRKFEPYDRVALNRIKKKMTENGYSMNTLIQEIIMTKQFRYRQDLP